MPKGRYLLIRRPPLISGISPIGSKAARPAAKADPLVGEVSPKVDKFQG
ncbi:MAG: hypothetical protein ABSH16_03285 [Sedimentisphaerales bacterium]